VCSFYITPHQRWGSKIIEQLMDEKGRGKLCKKKEKDFRKEVIEKREGERRKRGEDQQQRRERERPVGEEREFYI